jgi:hypothetical protein
MRYETQIKTHNRGLYSQYFTLTVKVFKDGVLDNRIVHTSVQLPYLNRLVRNRYSNLDQTARLLKEFAATV